MHIRSALFWLCFVLTWLILFVPMLIGCVYRPWLPLKFCRLVASSMVLYLKIFCGVNVIFRGTVPENLPNMMVASKHQSLLEAGLLLIPFPKGTYILKNTLMKVPFFNAFIWGSKMITIERTGATKALKGLIMSAQKAFRDGRTLIIFPEGTRRLPSAPPAYKPGVNYIYNQLDVNVVPVAVNSGTILPKNAWVFRRGNLIIDILPPIPPNLDKNSFKNELQSSIEQASQDLLDENR